MSRVKNAALAAGILLTSTVGTGAALAADVAEPAAPAPSPYTQVTASPVAEDASPYVRVANVEGTFEFDQTTLTPNATIKRYFGEVADVLCREGARPTPLSLDYQIAVGGDVANPYAFTLAELGTEQGIEQVLGCSCAGNLANGAAVANALVKGVPVADLWAMAHPEAGVNTVTFTCADGTRASLPLTYLVQHRAVVAYEVNGEGLTASMGAVNQLWIPSSSARYYYRDIISIEFTAEPEAPASPTFDETGETYVNQPSINVRAV